MIRRGLVTITLVFVLSLAIRASAEPPRQADIDACNKEAAAAAPQPAASPDPPSATAEAPKSTKTEDGASPAQPTMKGSEAATTLAERQAFAACLARHGYYKGYYH